MVSRQLELHTFSVFAADSVYTAGHGCRRRFLKKDRKHCTVRRFYIDVLGFHRYWSVDDSQIHTEYSSLRSIVVCDYDENVKMPVNEPAPGRGKSQIQEFVEYYDGVKLATVSLSIHAVTFAVAH